VTNGARVRLRHHALTRDDKRASVPLTQEGRTKTGPAAFSPFLASMRAAACVDN
jgi:hypothetical protein